MKIESSFFNTADYDQEMRFELYRDIIGGAYSVRLDQEVLPNLHAKIKCYFIDNIIVAEGETVSQFFSRDEKKIAEGGFDHFIVQLFFFGKTMGTGIHDGKIGAPSSILFIDCAKPWTAFNSNFRSLSVTIPRMALREQIGGLHHLHGYVLRTQNNPFAKLFEDFVFNYYRYIDLLERESSGVIARNSIDLLVAALRYDNKKKFSEADRLHLIGSQIKQYIEANISDPGLSVNKLADKFSLSRSSLYRLFPEQNGGLNQFIKKKRMNRAYLELLNRSGSKNISEIAFACGFKNVSSFSRSFKEHFQLPPKELLLNEIKNEDRLITNINDHVLWHQWLKIT